MLAGTLGSVFEMLAAMVRIILWVMAQWVSFGGELKIDENQARSFTQFGMREQQVCETYKQKLLKLQMIRKIFDYQTQHSSRKSMKEDDVQKEKKKIS